MPARKTLKGKHVNKDGKTVADIAQPKRSDTALRWRRFAENYAVSLDPVESAIRAGYDADRAVQTSGELLKNPAVQRYIDEYEMKRRAALQVDDREIIAELVAIGFSDIRDYITVDAKGRISIRPLHQINGVAAKAVQEIYETAGGKPRIRLHSKMDALARLAAMVGMKEGRGDDIDEGEDDFSRFSTEELERFISESVAEHHGRQSGNGSKDGGGGGSSSSGNGSSGLH